MQDEGDNNKKRYTNFCFVLNFERIEGSVTIRGQGNITQTNSSSDHDLEFL
jgi:hypothetical protein